LRFIVTEWSPGKAVAFAFMRGEHNANDTEKGVKVMHPHSGKSEITPINPNTLIFACAQALELLSIISFKFSPGRESSGIDHFQ
jgi:hypothetical protein